MQNKLEDLNNHLFAQIERLGNEDLTGDELTMEINRAKAVSSVAVQIIDNARLVLKAVTAANDGIIRKLPKMLGAD